MSEWRFVAAAYAITWAALAGYMLYLVRRSRRAARLASDDRLGQEER